MYIDAKKWFEKEVGPLTLGKLLWAIRKSDELSQEAFAKTLKISKSHLCDIEKGRKFLSLERAQAFAKRLGYPPKQFVRLAIQDWIASSGLKYRVILEAAA